MKRGREQRPHSCGLLSPFPNLNPGLGRGGPGQTSSLLLALRVSLNYTERHLVCTTDACLRCQAENKQEDCVVVWGECNHSFHNCCMSLWVKQNNRCPLCQQDWVVQRIGK
ncbi:RING-box protein 2 isoform X2 [Rhineura floridana]|uniref:RING-box protein 2 isoform X2 n=1 Tax=Rhineura floridana TaxID=261503 RepID=UPI002AC85956|nr:RING-box protein 2 isoform X2 [Rhineura floridana]